PTRQQLPPAIPDRFSISRGTIRQEPVLDRTTRTGCDQELAAIRLRATPKASETKPSRARPGRPCCQEVAEITRRHRRQMIEKQPGTMIKITRLSCSKRHW